ncbi:hypothetical protein BU24DRAFT_496899 [Aaosphaeria arxii CBS 175.79]|uniref:Uncharacterized protein n=1 Tax=Aaosphaeria arxii CBS 175.79 TaxID=1450172 RepID=A0A6A5XBE2_9PLEO|nr:uncharacterized protein BU24DRAFT_496899 [Aaosphaeria arxii CBS 175.79]KAF2010117.1 hypothetical protein BU24DRAFT_496899 [Aaosphaeria arxii CBS 175.79]
MWFLQPSVAAIGLIALSNLPSAVAKPYPVEIQQTPEQSLQNDTQIEKRQCAGTLCGFYNQLCCAAGETCYTNANNEAVCGKGQANPGGSWSYWTSTWVESETVTKTQVFSSYVGAATPQATAACSDWQNPCGSLCCDSGYYCLKAGQCALVGGGSSGGIIGTLTPSAPLRPTSSTLIIVTATGSPTATKPFSTPIPTGVNGTLVEQGPGDSGGLSGGAIAGIVIGVLLGLLLLLLICFYCCAKSLFDTILACFGCGKKRKHTHEETYIEEHHHSHGGAAAGGGRTWFGTRPSRPDRPSGSGGFGNALGIGAGLAGLALALGLKRKHDARHDRPEMSSYTGSSAYYSDYTSSSSASSDDRRSRPTRHSSRR